MRARAHLGGEVPVEEALAVQVVESPGDVQRQAQAHLPRQVHLAAQQLLQVTAVDVLKAKRVRTSNQNKQKSRPLSNAAKLATVPNAHSLRTSVRAWSCPS